MKKNPFKLDVVSVRLVKDAPIYSEHPIQSPKDAVQVVGDVLCEMDREVICVINTNAKGIPINCSFVSMGVIEAALATPRDMLKASILSNATGTVLVHNHPSGDISPSEEDFKVTERFMVACHFLGIEFLDHIIVGGNNKKFYSFDEEDFIKMKKSQYDAEVSRVASERTKKEKVR